MEPSHLYPVGTLRIPSLSDSVYLRLQILPECQWHKFSPSNPSVRPHGHRNVLYGYRPYRTLYTQGYKFSRNKFCPSPLGSNPDLVHSVKGGRHLFLVGLHWFWFLPLVLVPFGCFPMGFGARREVWWLDLRVVDASKGSYTKQKRPIWTQRGEFSSEKK